MAKIFILEPGHSKATPGKRSPDGRLLEYAYNREILSLVTAELDKLHIQYFLTVPEVDREISLTERANRANKLAKQYGVNNCLFVSLHSNAAGNGGWMTGQGWEVYTSVGLTKSDSYATIFLDEATKECAKHHRKVRGKKEANFTVLQKTVCPAVLVESFFYDNKEEMEWMLTEEGKKCAADIIVNSIKRINAL